MGHAFSRGERPPAYYNSDSAAYALPSPHGIDDADGEIASMLSVNITMPAHGDGDAHDDGRGEVVARFSLPDEGHYIRMAFNEFTLYIEADGQMVLCKERTPGSDESV